MVRLVSGEAASAGWRMCIDAVSIAMYGYVVVVPTERGEVVRMVGATIGTSDDVVWFESVSRIATVNHAAAIPVGSELADCRRDCSGCRRCDDG